MKTIKHEDKIKKEKVHEMARCTVAANPEMARNNYEDEPCDDNRA